MKMISVLLLTLACQTVAASRIPTDASLCEVLQGGWQVHLHPSNTVANLELSSMNEEANDRQTWSVSTTPNPHFTFNAVVIGSCRSNDDNAMLEVDVGAIYGSHESEDVLPVMERIKLSVSTSWKDSRVASGTFKECTILLTVLSQSVFQLVWMCPGQPMHSALGQRTSALTAGVDTTDGFSWNHFWEGKQAQFWLIAGALGFLQILKWRRRMASIEAQQGRSGSGSGGIASGMKQRILERRQAAKAKSSSSAGAAGASGAGAATNGTAKKDK